VPVATRTASASEGIVGEPADLVGWSDGATVALLVALSRPDLVKRLVYVGQPINHSSLAPEVAATLDQISPAVLPPPLRPLYDAVSPDGPEHFDIVFAKVSNLWVTHTGMAIDELEVGPAAFAASIPLGGVVRRRHRDTGDAGDAVSAAKVEDLLVGDCP